MCPSCAVETGDVSECLGGVVVWMIKRLKILLLYFGYYWLSFGLLRILLFVLIIETNACDIISLTIYLEYKTIYLEYKTRIQLVSLTKKSPHKCYTEQNLRKLKA